MKKKRTIAVTATSIGLSALLVMGVGAQAFAEADFDFGRYDVNGDGSVNISDVTALLSFLATTDCGHIAVTVEGKEGNCFEEGLTEGVYCSACGKTLVEQTVIPAGHEYDEEGEFRIREKTYTTRPMTAEEAILQMNLLGHSFFAFYNDDVGGVCVVYKRKDGDYGMMSPER